jgi:hypothetical protein
MITGIGTSYNADQDRPISEIEEYSQRLESMIGQISHTMEMLRNKLSPVMNENMGKGGATELGHPEPVLCPLGSFLRARTEQLDRISGELSYILDSVKL